MVVLPAMRAFRSPLRIWADDLRRDAREGLGLGHAQQRTVGDGNVGFLLGVGGVIFGCGCSLRFRHTDGYASPLMDAGRSEADGIPGVPSAEPPLPLVPPEDDFSPPLDLSFLAHVPVM